MGNVTLALVPFNNVQRFRCWATGGSVTLRLGGPSLFPHNFTVAWDAGADESSGESAAASSLAGRMLSTWYRLRDSSGAYMEASATQGGFSLVVDGKATDPRSVLRSNDVIRVSVCVGERARPPSPPSPWSLRARWAPTACRAARRLW